MPKSIPSAAICIGQIRIPGCPASMAEKKDGAFYKLDRRLVRALRIFAAFGTLAAGCLASSRGGVNAQELEPRAYSPAPIGTNFLIPSFVHADDDASLDPSLPITGVKASIDAFTTGYERTFDLFGRSASAAVLLPYVQSVLTGQLNQQGGRTTRYGLGDTALRLQVNLLGAPAQTPAEFFQHEPSTTLGTSLTMLAPTGQYDPQRLINISSNRWAFRPEIGPSQPFGSWFAETSAGVWLFTDNNNFFGGHVRSQAPIEEIQIHGGYTFRPGLWLAADATYYTSGETSLDGVAKHDAQANSRYGVTLSVPLLDRFAAKLAWSSWFSVNKGARYQTIGVTLQYRWFDRQSPAP